VKTESLIKKGGGITPYETLTTHFNLLKEGVNSFPVFWE